MLYEPSGETEDNEEGKQNDPKDGGGIMKKKNIPASATQIKQILNMEKQDIVNAKHFEYEFLNCGCIKKIKWVILGDTEYIIDNNLVDLPDDDGPEIPKKIYWINMNDSFFSTIFPSV